MTLEAYVSSSFEEDPDPFANAFHRDFRVFTVNVAFRQSDARPFDRSTRIVSYCRLDRVGTTVFTVLG